MTGVINVSVPLPAGIFPVVIRPSGGLTPPVALLLHQTCLRVFPHISVFLHLSPRLIIFLIIIFTCLPSLPAAPGPPSLWNGNLLICMQ